MTSHTIPEPSGPLFELRVNAAGSWARCGYFHAPDYRLVTESCKTLIALANGKIAFKTLNNDDNSLIEKLDWETVGGTA